MASNSMIINIALRGGKTAVKGLKRISSEIGNAGRSAGKGAMAFAKAGTMIGVAVGGVALREASKFGDKLREIGTLGSEVSEDMKRMSKELRLVAGEFGQPIGAVAKAQYDIISAGMGDVVTSSAILRESSKLAVAGVTDVGTTADVITSAMNAYGQSVEDVGDTSAILFQTVKSGKTTMTELGASLGQVIPFASSAKMPLDQVGSAMASITAKGVSTAEASTALKGAIVGLTNATPGSIQAMSDLGIEIVKTSEGGLDFNKTMESIATAQEKNPDAINKIMPNIRGQLALKSITADMGAFRTVVNDFATKDANLVQGAVDEMNKSFGQQSRMLKENLRGGMIELGTEIGTALLPQISAINTKLQAIGQIGWGVIGKRVVDNMGAIWNAMVETSGVMIGRLAVILPGKIWEALKLIWDMVKEVGVFLWEPIAKGWKLVWLGIKMAFVGAINWIVEQVNTLSEKMNKLPGVNIGMIQKISTTYGEEMNKLANESTRFEDMFNAGADSSESASEKIKNIWSDLNTKLFEVNEETKANNDQLAENFEKTAEGVGASSEEQTDKLGESNKKQDLGYANSLGGLRSKIKGYLAEAIAGLMAKEIGTKGIFGLITASAGAIAVSTLFDKMIPKFAKGGEFITDRPQLMMVGDNPGARERVSVEPLSSPGYSGGGKNVTLNISAPLVDETVIDSILPSIKRAMDMELA